MNKIKFRSLIKHLVFSQQADEDLRRRELILNILLLFSLFCFALINIIRIIDILSNPQDSGLSLIYTLIILAFFVFLFWLSKKGRITAAAILLLLTYSSPMFYSFIFWGADLPAALLLAVLIIILSGILLGERLVLISTVFLTIFLIVLTQLQANGTILIQNYWRQEKNQLADAISYAVLFIVIAAVAWIFASEIKKALKRARLSEAALKEERDSLEIKVIKRTNELRQAEAEKINQLYRLAEFGRLSSGVFHDLINPLTAVSLNLEQVKNEGENQFLNAKTSLDQAILATRRMEELIASIKKQISRESSLKSFSLNEEINQVIQILAYKARRANTLINFTAPAETNLYGDPIKFGQIITNLLCNAIEAGEEGTANKVNIDLQADNEQILLRVSDQGTGITPENLAKIFEPFFSTKLATGRGLGLGLSSTKNLIEKNFHGSITVTSQPAQGTEFIIKLPFKNEN
ncbi:MAG: HAMP domain-containing sensor histidine kinase [Patescibacteria group bacterium]|jgi:signal transduction histidine kinase